MIFVQYIEPPKHKRKLTNVLPHSNIAPAPPSKLERLPISPLIPTPSPPANNTHSISPLPKLKRTRLAKPAIASKRAEPLPPTQVHAAQGVNYFLDSRNREDKDQALYLDFFKRSVRTYKPPPRSTSSHGKEKEVTLQKTRIRIPTFELVDEDGGRVGEYRIFKDSDKFFGNVYKLGAYGKDCTRDNDIQTTYEERTYGEKKSTKVLARAIRTLSKMKVHFL